MAKWIKRWRYEISERPIKPQIWRIKDGGVLARVRVKDPRTGKMVDTLAVHPDVEAAAAWQLRTRKEVRDGAERDRPTRMKFVQYARSLLDRKVKSGEIKSAASLEVWQDTLTHHLAPAFGDYYMDAITRVQIKEWLALQGKRVRAREYSVRTVNSWFAKLRVILRCWADDQELDRCPISRVRPLDEAEYPVYTEEQPNSLDVVAEMPRFSAAMFRRFPQHFAMVALGFATGWRPSSLRPLRRKGPLSDIDWDKGTVLLRRSHSRGQAIMNTTKISVTQKVQLPAEMMEILRWHVDRLQGPQLESDLLFPRRNGTIQPQSCLLKAFWAVSEELQLKKDISPRAMRRTYQDLCRAAQVKDLVTRSVSGHLTEQMQSHYSTVSRAEQSEGLAKVIELAGFRRVLDGVKNGVKEVEQEEADLVQPRKKPKRL